MKEEEIIRNESIIMYQGHYDKDYPPVTNSHRTTLRIEYICIYI